MRKIELGFLLVLIITFIVAGATSSVAADLLPNIITANVDGDPQNKDDVIIDFGPQYGIWIYYNNSTWQQLHYLSPKSIVNGDLDGNGKDDLIIDFGLQDGIWINYNNLGWNGWSKLHDLSPKSMVTADPDGNGKTDIIIDFGKPYGIWIRYNDSTWIKLHDLSPESMVAGDIDGNGKDDVIIDFGKPYGIWILYNDSTWTQISSIDPESMVAGDLDGDGKDDLAIDFGIEYGIWTRYNDSTWTKLHDLSPKSMVTGDIDGNGKDDIIIDFGKPYGIWIRYNDSTWIKLHDLSPESMVAGDIDGNGKDDVIIDFGTEYGIWVHYNNSSWQKLHDLSPWALNLPPPEFVKLTDKTAVIGTLLEFKIEASDLNIPEAELTYTAENLPPQATFDSSTRAFLWTPAFSDKGTYEVTFTVSNGAASASKTIILSTVYIEEARITNGASVVGKPAIYKERIVWSDNRNSPNRLYMYNIATHVESPINIDIGEKFRPAIYGERIVYLEYETGQDYGLYIYDLSTAEKTIIADLPNGDNGPVIYKDRVAWLEDISNIRLYDIRTGQVSSVSDAGSNHEALAIYEDTLFWETRKGDIMPSSDIYAYDLLSAAKSMVLGDFSSSGFAVYGDKLVWYESSVGYGWVGRLIRSGLWLYNISTKEKVHLTLLSGSGNLAMYENRIVWSGNDGQIYLTTMTFSPRIISASGESTPEGYKVNIIGTNFGYSQNSSTIELDGGITASIKSRSDTNITCVISPGVLSVGDHVLKVSTSGGRSNGVKVTLPAMLNAPTTLSAAAASSTRVNLSWQDNSEDEDGFKIELSSTGGSTFNEIGTVGKDVSTFRVDNLTSNKTYHFRVYAYAAGNYSSYSNIVSATTLSLTKPTINAFDSPTREPIQTLSGTKDIDTSIWMNGLEKIPIDDLTTWSVSIMLAEGQNKINVIAKDSALTESDPALADILLDTTPPTTPIVTDDGVTSRIPDALHAGWTAQDQDTGISEYQYAVGTVPGGTDILDWTSCGTQTEITKNGLTLISGKTYHFSVKAKNNVGLWSSVGSSDGIIILQTAPTITALSPIDGSMLEAGNAMTFNITAEDPEEDLIQYKIAVGGQVISDWTSTASFNWDTTSQPSGSKEAVIYARDTWGNEASRNIEIYIARRALGMPRL